MCEVTRCGWVDLRDPLYVRYHDTEWGVPVRDDQALFERLCLEGAFDPVRVAAYDDTKIAALLNDSGIIRNRLKIHSVVRNARAFQQLVNDYGKFSDYFWSFVGGRTLHNHWPSLGHVPAQTELSRAISRDLRQRGFTFVGPTICYAAMQACGLVNDHTTDCFRHAQLGGTTG